MQDKLYQQFESFWENKDYSQKYWNWKLGIARSKRFAKHLKHYDFESIYEFGMNAGRNLYYIKQYFPNIVIGGSDISGDAIQYAKTQMPDGYFETANVCEYSSFDIKYDIVFTMGTLIHIAPDRVYNALLSCLVKSKKYVMHLEGTSSFGIILNGPKSMNPVKKEKEKFIWQPNIIKLYKDIGIYKTKAIDVKSLHKKNDYNKFIIVEK